MPEYLDLDLIAPDPLTLQQDGRDWITAQAPDGYVVDPWVDWLLSAVARMAVEVAVLAGRVPLAIFETFGQRVLGVPSLTATPAVGTVTFTLADTVGHTIPAGAQLDIDNTAFVTTDDLVVPAGAGTGQVAVEAMVPGAQGTGLLGTTVDLISPTFVWVNNVTLLAPTTGGLDGETDDEYVDRLADELPTLSPKAILVDDFAALARTDLEVERALALDNYNPGPPVDTAAEGHVSVFAINAAGQPVSAAAKARVASMLADARVLNLAVHVLDPTYSTVDVTWTGTTFSDFNATAVRDAANTALADFLSPARWGQGIGAETPPNAWVNEPTVRRNDLFGVLYLVQGIRHIDTLTVALNGGAQGTADLTMPGPAPLPQPGVITGTVTL